MPSVQKIAPTPRGTNTGLFADQLTPHVLTIGSYTNYLPQEFIDPTSHKLTGFDIDLIQTVAQRLNLRPTVVPTDFQMLISDLLARRFDVVISAVTITPELQKVVNFIPYFRGGESLLVGKGNPLHIAGLSDLCGLHVAVKNGTVELQELQAATSTCTASGKASISLSITESHNASIQALADGEVAASYQDSAVTDYFLKTNPQRFEVGGPVNGASVEGIAIRKDDMATYTLLKNTFNKLTTDGTYHNLIAKWGLYSGDITHVITQHAILSEPSRAFSNAGELLVYNCGFVQEVQEDLPSSWLRYVVVPHFTSFFPSQVAYLSHTEM